MTFPAATTDGDNSEEVQIDLPITQDLLGRKFENMIGNIVVSLLSLFSFPLLSFTLGPCSPSHLIYTHTHTHEIKTHTQWDAAVSMHKFFQTEFPPGHFKDKVVLELGSGTGLGTSLFV